MLLLSDLVFLTEALYVMTPAVSKQRPYWINDNMALLELRNGTGLAFWWALG